MYTIQSANQMKIKMSGINQSRFCGLLLVLQTLSTEFVSEAYEESKITVKDSETVILPCRVFPNGGRITWFKGRELIAQDGEILRYMSNIFFAPGNSFDEWNLEILRADRAFEDVYYCQLDGKLVHKVRVVIDVPSNKLEPGSQFYRVREPVTLNTTLICEVVGYPVANITWSTKNGDESRAFRQISTTASMSNFNNITRFTDETYSCEVNQGFGVQTSDALRAVKLVTMCMEQRDRMAGWWGYDSSSGPSEWAKSTSKDWTICRDGKNQSPINIIPQTLLFDPHLKPVHIEGAMVNGILKNTGRDVSFFIENDVNNLINLTSGPLSYTYRLYQIKLHFGSYNSLGSEHTVNGTSFPGEIHFIAYNVDLYDNYSIAAASPRGLAIIAVFISVGTSGNSAFTLLSEKFTYIEPALNCVEVFDLPIDKLLPQTDHYMTYSGSLTHPSCMETVTWILYNKPIYISQAQMNALRTIPYQEWHGSNTRPVMPLNHRTIRTNINVYKKSNLCTMEVSKTYQVNPNIGQ